MDVTKPHDPTTSQAANADHGDRTLWGALFGGSAALIGMLLGPFFATPALNALDRRDEGPSAPTEIAAVRQVAFEIERSIVDSTDGLPPAHAPGGVEGTTVVWYSVDDWAYSLCVAADGKMASYDSKTAKARSGDCRGSRP